MQHAIYSITINDEQICKLFSSLFWFKTLKRLEIDNQDLRTLSLDVISHLINNMESAQFRDCLFNVAQLNDTFKKMASKDTKLKKVFIADIAEDVDAHLLAEGLNNIKTPLWRNLSTSQLNQVYRQMTIASKIKMLSLIEEDLKGINPSLLANALNSIQELWLRLYYDDDIKEQINEIFLLMSKKTNLKKLKLYDSSLCGIIPPVVVSKAINNIKDVRFNFVHLSSEQKEAIMLLKSTQDTVLENFVFIEDTANEGERGCCS